LHGHNYKVFAHVCGSELNEGGMLLDFTKLKGALRTVCKTLDHTNLNDFEIFDQNPSAERIAVYIYNGILEELKKENIDLSFEMCYNEQKSFSGFSNNEIGTNDCGRIVYNKGEHYEQEDSEIT
jgi:6-pyruvoyl tetrahydropterin synthase/QueD family protein